MSSDVAVDCRNGNMGAGICAGKWEEIIKKEPFANAMAFVSGECTLPKQDAEL